MPEEHAKLSPSAGDRWLNCAVAPVRELAFEDKGSDAAAEGIAAHAMAAYCLTNKLDACDAPDQHKDWMRWDSPVFRAHVQTYLDFVRSKETPTSSLFIEQRLSIMSEFDVWGTADAVIVDTHTLRIADLKFGQGVMVSADDNPQLALYGWGAYDTLDWLASEEITHIEVSIHQPRRSNVVSATFTADELKAWIVEHTPKVRKAFRAVASDEATPGSHCMWCKARHVCKERAEFNLATARFDFDTIADPTCVPDDPKQINEELLTTIFLRLPMLEKWIKDVETEVARRANDHPVEGLKWVAGRKMRYITDVDAAATILETNGINPWADRKLLGFGDLEKATKAAGIGLKDIIGDYIGSKLSAPALVSVDDKRPSLDRNAQAAVDFQDDL